MLLASVVLLPVGKTINDCGGIGIGGDGGTANPPGGTTVNINGNSYPCGQYCDLPFTISPTNVTLTFF
jgi:hypothetical protein